MEKSKNNPNPNNNNPNNTPKVTNSEIIQVIKESNNFPLHLSNPVPLKQLITLYNKYWNNELTDDEESDTP